MSDIQRYGFYRNDWDGGSAPARFRELDNGEYVKYDDINRIKAEGIRDMVKAFKRQAWEMHCDNFAIEYADKLEKGDEN